jgi:hypothetical protein
MLVAAYHILRDGTEYRDLGGTYLGFFGCTGRFRHLAERSMSRRSG